VEVEPQMVVVGEAQELLGLMELQPLVVMVVMDLPLQ
jgi:hypothetical protein